MASYEISVDHTFTARHAVLLDHGHMELSHEHIWRVTATFRSDTLAEPMGVVVDFLDVQAAMRQITSDLDGGDLNAVPEIGESPSAERVAKLLARRLAGVLGPVGRSLYRLAVSEAPGCVAAYYPAGG